MSRKKDTAPTYGCCRGWGRYFVWAAAVAGDGGSEALRSGG